MRTPSRPAVLALLVVASLLAGCADAAVAAQPVPRWNAWLCGPAAKPDWCNVEMATTVFAARGARRVVREPAGPKRPIDCFYLYPSIAPPTSTLKVGAAEKQIVVIQASRFGLACRVFAPLYRQAGDSSYSDAQAAWHDYLAHHNHGRGVVLIGHSHGAYDLTRLIREEVERSSAQRRLLVSAILLGANVTVEKGSDRGGSFERIPACRSATQTGCVVAYSAWSRTPPQDAGFQRVDGTSEQVLCVNPAAPGGGRAKITPTFPWFAPEGIVPGEPDPPVKTVWIGLPNKYTARCVTSGSRAWLLVEDAGRAGDVLPRVQEILAPGWGLHAADVNIALEQLVELVRGQGAAWTSHR